MVSMDTPVLCTEASQRSPRVEHILKGVSEADKVLYRDNSPDHGFVLLPDMKWDLTNISTLYLVAISLNRSIRSLRDLKKEHIGMLRSIKAEASRIVQEKWNLSPGCLRFVIHYQPSYCQWQRECAHLKLIFRMQIIFMSMS